MESLRTNAGRGDGGDSESVEFAIDITERKEAEEALREAEQRFRAVVNLVPNLLWSSEPSGYTGWYDQRWMEYTGEAKV